MVYPTPVVNQEILSSKEMIVSILSEEFPMSINKIRKKLVSKYSKSITYQGVYKEINLLVSNNILKKEGKEYLLNEEWIVRLRDFSRNLCDRYRNEKVNSIDDLDKLKKEGDIITLDFNSLRERDEYFVCALDHFNKELIHDEKVIMHYKHNYWPILNSDKLSTIMKHKKSNNNYFNVCSSNTRLDKWGVSYQNEIGMNVKIVPNFKKEFNFQVYGDIVVQFHIPSEIVSKMDEYFESCKNLNDFKVGEFIEILNMKGKISAVITKNYALASSLRDQVLEQFKEEIDMIDSENMSKGEYFY